MGMVLSPIVSVAVNALALYGLTQIVSSISYTGGLKFFVIGGLILGIINAVIRPLLKILSFPFIIVTAGLFLIVINMAILWFLSYFLDVLAFQDVTFTLPDLKSYVIGALVFGIINWAVNLIST